jgi:hypothetical protein
MGGERDILATTSRMDGAALLPSVVVVVAALIGTRPKITISVVPVVGAIDFEEEEAEEEEAAKGTSPSVIRMPYWVRCVPGAEGSSSRGR